MPRAWWCSSTSRRASPPSGCISWSPQERLNARQWAGVLVAFGGVAIAFGDGFASGRGTLLGDLFGVLGALFWALTTILIRATKLAAVSPAKTLFYQLAVSAPVLLLAAWLMGEPGVIRLTPPVVAAFAYQCIAVAFASYLTWFWLLRHYLAARLSVFSFLTPIFGVLAGVLLLGEPLTLSFVLAAAAGGGGPGPREHARQFFSDADSTLTQDFFLAQLRFNSSRRRILT